jgi:hypothetical protein
VRFNGDRHNVTSLKTVILLDCIWNVMAHAQKPDFVFRRNGRLHLNRQGASVQSTTGSRGVCIGGSNAGYTMFRGSVKSTSYPLHSPVSLSLPLPCVTVCHHISTGLHPYSPYHYWASINCATANIMWRVLAAHFIRQFPLHFPSRASPCVITFQLDSTLSY